MFKMYKIWFLLLFVVFLYGEKVEITSDSMKAEELKSQVHFIGNVTIKQLKSWLHGDKVIVYFDENNETKQYDALGNVTFEYKNEQMYYNGRAKKVTYDPQKEIYILTGDAVIDDLINKRHINGNVITLNLVSGLADVQGNKNEPVKFIFETEEKKKKK